MSGKRIESEAHLTHIHKRRVHSNSLSQSLSCPTFKVAELSANEWHARLLSNTLLYVHVATGQIQIPMLLHY